MSLLLLLLLLLLLFLLCLGDNSSQDKSLLTPTVPQKLKKIKQFDLSSIVKPLSRGDEQLLGIAAFQRILDTDGTLLINNNYNN